MDSIELIESLLAKPYVYTCGESLIALRSFLNGYSFCRIEHKVQEEASERYSLLPASWLLFTEYVRCSLTYDEPDADWFDILMTYFGDKEGYRMFVSYFDSFRRLEMTSFRRASLSSEQQEHFTKSGVFKNIPISFCIAEMNRGSCYMSACEFENEVWQTRHIFRTEEEAAANAVQLFGSEPVWFGVTGVEGHNFRKPVRMALY